MSINPFDDDDGRLRVSVNGEEHYSLRPAVADAPTGWGTAYGEADRPARVDHIELNWTDIRRPNLRERLLDGWSTNR